MYRAYFGGIDIACFDMVAHGFILFVVARIELERSAREFASHVYFIESQKN